jgi:hypothetical protein
MDYRSGKTKRRLLEDSGSTSAKLGEQEDLPKALYVLKCISQGLTAGEIMERLNVDNDIAELWFNFLNEIGLLRWDTSNWTWVLTDAGKIQLAENLTLG